MGHSHSLISAIINFVIILFVIRVVTKTIRKNKDTKQADDRSHTHKPMERETTLNMTPEAKNLKHEQTSFNRGDLQLKRCSNCGGEIPLTMMKCELCGHRQAGCLAGIWIMVIVVILLILGVYFSKSGYELRYLIQQALDWLSSL